MSRLFLRLALCALALIPQFASGQDADDAAIALTLDDAVAHALERQPQLRAQQAAVRAARESAFAAGQLPDPKLSAGISDLTITGPDRYTLRRESDTQIGVSVMQEFPRGRAELNQQAQRLASAQDAQLARLERVIARDTALAWLDVWKPQRAVELARSSEQQSRLQLEVSEIAYRNNRATQAEVLAARVALESLRDEIAALEQEAAHARNLLARWIGAAAFGLICPELPAARAQESLDALLEKLRAHPHLNASREQIAVAQAGVAVAQQDYKPGWGVELGYGHRPAFSDYAALKFSFDLPVFTHNRQDRGLAAALAQLEQATHAAEDDWREHSAELRLNYTDWQLLQARLQRFDQTILPSAAQRIEAARLAWQSGSGSLAQVLDARRAELASRMQRLSLQLDQAKHQIQLNYLTGNTHE